MPPFSIALLVAAFFMVSSPAHGQRMCMGRDNLLTQLYLQAQEQPVVIALVSTGVVLEVLTDDDGSTWTMIVTNSTGFSCVVGTGVHWFPIEPAKGPDL